MSSEVMIKAEGLGKAYLIYKRPQDRLKQMLWRGRRRYYDEYWALQGADLEIRRGETIGIIGRNGSGKSTLLQMICGTVTPSSGTLSVQGRVAALLELGTGFNPEFTGRENVYLSASVLGLDTKEITARFEMIAEFAGIGDFIEQPVKLYSSGMYARLAFAVAAHVDADLLIVDEILSVGDAAFGQKCMRYIQKFRQNGTLLFVSHDTGAVVNLCDRVIWLDGGRVRGAGPAKEVCHDYLAALQEEKDDAHNFKIGGRRQQPAELRPVQDPRRELLKDSDKRNTIEVFDFDPDAPWFGQRGASIVDVTLTDTGGERLVTLDGGEEVVLSVRCRAEQLVGQPIIGFYVRDRLGQNLFGDNTYLTFRDEPMPVQPGQYLTARFRFQMPYLPVGDFSIVAAIAEGTQEDHVQHHWVDDALFFRVQASHLARGLIGVPMLDIAMTTAPAEGVQPR